LLGKTGVDARIFRVMGDNDISVSIISQGSSERGIGLVVAATSKAMIELEKNSKMISILKMSIRLRL
jgi:aspartokinase/homoserine dehydrogenase 1